MLSSFPFFDPVASITAPTNSKASYVNSIKSIVSSISNVCVLIKRPFEYLSASNGKSTDNEQSVLTFVNVSDVMRNQWRL